MIASPLAEPRVRKWTLTEYNRAAASGLFDDERVQLIEGEIIEMPPQGHRHVKAVWRMTNLLQSAYGADRWVRSQAPLNVGTISQPEPDIAVAERPMADYTDHPSTLILAVEISDTTLSLDRRKASIYAAAGVREYWILNLDERVLEVFANPAPDSERGDAWAYAGHRVLPEADSVALPDLAETFFAIRDFLT